MKKIKNGYLQIEFSGITFYRDLKNMQEVLEWYEHLVENRRRDNPFHLVTRFPIGVRSKRPEYCVIDLAGGCFLEKGDIKNYERQKNV